MLYDAFTHLVVDVIWAQPPNNHANESAADGNPLEVALRVVARPFGSRLGGVAGAAQELADVVQVGVGRGAGGTEAPANPVSVKPYIVALMHLDVFVKIFYI